MVVDGRPNLSLVSSRGSGIVSAPLEVNITPDGRTRKVPQVYAREGIKRMRDPSSVH